MSFQNSNFWNFVFFALENLNVLKLGGLDHDFLNFQFREISVLKFDYFELGSFEFNFLEFRSSTFGSSEFGLWGSALVWPCELGSSEFYSLEFRYSKFCTFWLFCIWMILFPTPTLSNLFLERI